MLEGPQFQLHAKSNHDYLFASSLLSVFCHPSTHRCFLPHYFFASLPLLLFISTFIPSVGFLSIPARLLSPLLVASPPFPSPTRRLSNPFARLLHFPASLAPPYNKDSTLRSPATPATTPSSSPAPPESSSPSASPSTWPPATTSPRQLMPPRTELHQQILILRLSDEVRCFDSGDFYRR